MENSTISKQQVIVQLFLVSLLSLFCELLVIRWLSTEIRIFAYFKNLPLMAAFLGLGLGFFWTNRRISFFKWSSLCLLYFSGLMIVAIGLRLTHMNFIDASKFMLFGDFQKSSTSIFKFASNLAVMLGIYSLSASIFVGLGQKTGQLFDKLKPLEAYSWNVTGALAGIVLFSCLSNFQLGPGLWLIVAGMLYWMLEKRPAPIFLIVLGITYIVYLAPLFASKLYGPEYMTTAWSPYYRIDVKRSRLGPDNHNVPIGYDIYINYDSFQTMADCTSATLAQIEESTRKKLLDFYERSFHVLPKKNPDVLILGAGTGSDVAAALRCNSNHVDAVEIDRSIYELGKILHPEHPYDSQKVTVHIMDARTFLKTATRKYDIIVYALLDSHTAFSSLSSLRTDNYVFTTESFSDAARLLKPEGYIAVCFICWPDWLWDRHCKDLYLGSQSMPQGYFWVTSLPTGFLVASPAINAKTPISFSHPPRKIDLNSKIPEITDDWPFLFLPERGIPETYIFPVLAVLIASLLPISRSIVSGSTTLLNWQMFCLGMGFMLLEVRAMSAMSLLAGATWTVNSIVIAGVMVVILLANLLAIHISGRAIWCLIPTAIAAIFLSNLVEVSNLNTLPAVLSNVVGSAVYLCPLFFAGAVFATLFKQTEKPSQAFAFNMFGGLLGVALEYLSMSFGIRALCYVGAAIYTSVLLLEGLRNRIRS